MIICVILLKWSTNGVKLKLDPDSYTYNIILLHKIWKSYIFLTFSNFIFDTIFYAIFCNWSFFATWLQVFAAL